MKNLSGAIRNTVSISQFNKGLAGKIFEDVKVNGTKVVMKNNVAECVLMSPEEYLRLMDMIEDIELESLANKRLESNTNEPLLTQEEVMADCGITQEQLDSMDEEEL